MTQLNGEICAECKWWDDLTGYTGICRRYPPSEGGKWPPLSKWPTTNQKDWCGEWTKPEAAP